MNNGKKNILVVDDDADITGLIKQGLEYLYPTEYHVTCVNCGKKCFELLKKNHTIPDVILLNISMPEMVGWEVFESLKRDTKWRYIPIVFLSEKTDKVAKNFGNFFGNDFIEKPFEIKSLRLRIERILK